MEQSASTLADGRFAAGMDDEEPSRTPPARYRNARVALPPRHCAGCPICLDAIAQRALPSPPRKGAALATQATPVVLRAGGRQPRQRLEHGVRFAAPPRQLAGRVAGAPARAATTFVARRRAFKKVRLVARREALGQLGRACRSRPPHQTPR